MIRACSKLMLVMTVAALQLPACSPSLLLDGVDDEPPPPTRKVRRDFEQEIRTLQQELDATRQSLEQAKKASQQDREAEPGPIELATSWEEAAELLPTDYAGQTDWMLAMTRGDIAPRPGLESGAQEQAVFDFDVRFADASDPTHHVTYEHAPHTQWLSCDNCHPAIFQLERGAKPPTITMARIKAGEYCGVCHGTVAFAVDNACARCHQGAPSQADWRPGEETRTPIETVKTWAEAERLLPVTGGMPDWAAALAQGVIDPRAGVDPDAPHKPILPLELELVPEATPLYKAVFDHQPHTAVLTCGNCHPGIFEMRAGADPITMARIFAGEYCGRCHGKVAFDVNTGCGRCHRALATGP
jgi:c(7)-type cytochrome triheme protein